MVAGLKPSHLQRYKDIGLLLLKFGQTDLIERTGLYDFLADAVKPSKLGRSQDANDLVAELERLGPAFVELGRFLSIRPDVLPPPYPEILSHVGEHETVILPFSQIDQIIRSEIGACADDFRVIEQQPVYLSSLSQSHKAVLNNGKSVIIKIQRPGIREKIYDDLDALKEVAQFCDDHTKTGRSLDLLASFEEIRKLIITELDYKQVAGELALFKKHMKEFSSIEVPSTFDDYSSSILLTSEFIEGQPIDTIENAGVLNSERRKLAEELTQTALKQVFTDGLVCTRINQNNIVINKMRQLALLSNGPFLRLSYSTQEKLIQLLLAIRQGKAEHATDLLISLSRKDNSFNESDLRKSVGEVTLQHRNAIPEKRAIGALLVSLSKSSGELGLKLTPEFPIIAGALKNLENCVTLLDPKFDTAGYIEQHLSEVARGRMAKALSPQNLFHNAIEVAELVEKLPAKVSRIVDSIASNDLEITVHTINEEVLIKGFQKIANRIALALVLAALIMGAAQLMQFKTSFTLWGYPGLAMLCFIFAAFFAFSLVVEIMVSDRH